MPGFNQPCYTSEHEVLATKYSTGFLLTGNGIGSVVYTGKINAYNQTLSTDIIETLPCSETGN